MYCRVKITSEIHLLIKTATPIINPKNVPYTTMLL